MGIFGVEYNPQVLENMAIRLYGQAKLVIARYCIIGIIPGLYYYYIEALDVAPYVLIAGVAIGYMFGKYKTLEIRVKAQELLCSVQIESHLKQLVENQAEQQSQPRTKDDDYMGDQEEDSHIQDDPTQYSEQEDGIETEDNRVDDSETPQQPLPTSSWSQFPKEEW